MNKLIIEPYHVRKIRKEYVEHRFALQEGDSVVLESADGKRQFQEWPDHIITFQSFQKIIIRKVRK